MHMIGSLNSMEIQLIEFINLNQDKPYIKFHEFYTEALKNNQKNIDAICISSFSSKKEVDSRYVNLKKIENNELIFFTNYNSPKALQFKNHSQVSISIFWQSIQVQVRIKAKVSMLDIKENQSYFATRSIEKNALAISSYQSKPIESFDLVKSKYKLAFKHKDLFVCPEYWGGYRCIPYEFEFWRGNDFRINKREFYKLNYGNWVKSILEP